MIFIKKNFFLFLLILFTLHQLNFFTNFFIIFKSDYQTRMIKFAGYCENHGYGYANHVKKKFNLNQNFLIRNFNNKPNVHGYFFNIDKIYNENDIILIGVNQKQLNEFLDKGFKIKDVFNNCYYISR
jgi:hypothetical protein